MREIQEKLQTKHFVAGRRLPALAGEKYTSLNPANNEPIATFVLGGAEDIDRAVGAARRAFDEGPWPRLPFKERVGILNRFATLIEREAEFLGRVECADVGKLLGECVGHDVARASANIRFFAGQVEQWQDEAFFSDAVFLGPEAEDPECDPSGRGRGGGNHRPVEQPPDVGYLEDGALPGGGQHLCW